MGSRYYDFKLSVCHWLQKDWEWSKVNAWDWIKAQPTYMRYMWEGSFPSDQVAEWIHKNPERGDR